MKMRILAVALATGLISQSAPAAAWYQWYRQDIPFAPVPDSWFYRGVPYESPGVANPIFGQVSPWFWFYQPALHHWWTMPNVSGGTYVEQSQSPSGYHIRVYVSGGRSGNLQISVEAGAIIVRSSEGVAASGQFQMQQSGWSTRWLALPADANLAAMRLSRGEDGVEIFVPRFR